ncbi:2-hydroxyglutaryl-CoA dehydratase [Candidatus Woesearchaeota archaeon]|nr:2-hydroxyglutaryl-CoA dehydratase [Candidatus Woesearchaeota archaeon]
MKKAYLGLDTGSVSCNIAVVDDKEVIYSSYARVQGKPIETLQKEFKKLKKKLSDVNIEGVCCTGSARFLMANIIGADVVKNEITAHATGTVFFVPDVRTILEIGGQDSKIILVKDGSVIDFAMNTVCAAGTGSFLDQQAVRLGLAIEDFGDEALKSLKEVTIRGRCGIFAESDVINKQIMGHKREDIINGLCKALVRNYMNNVAKGKTIEDPVVLQGGVAANKGIKKAFEEILDKKITVPKYHNVMGAVGAALIAKNAKVKQTKFKGLDISDKKFNVDSFECLDCPNRCEVVKLSEGDRHVAHLGSKCGKYE